MKGYFALAVLAASVHVCEASLGDQLPDYKSCVLSCNALLECGQSKLQSQLFAHQKYSEADFKNKYEVNYLSKFLFQWDCFLNCKYKCIRFVTEKRIKDKLEIFQYDGKWPFYRVLGITELFSALFLLANLYSNYVNIRKVYRAYRRSRQQEDNATWAYSSMYEQYLGLLFISCLGWTLSTIFHIRDFPVTETLDYFGAIAIILTNFKVIFVRYFELFKQQNKFKLFIFQVLLLGVYVWHCWGLLQNWDYDYNVKFNMVFGLGALILWVLHARNVSSVYKEKSHVYSNSLQLLPFETRIVSKLGFLSGIPVFRSSSKYIPLLPIYMNGLLVLGMLLEIWDFVPIGLMVDAHSLWHFATIFPPLVWYDWNLWDLELLKLRNIRSGV